jgi:hypothetical protein
MTYYRKQRMESFKRAMFADQLSNQSSREEAASATDANIKEEGEPWLIRLPEYAGYGSRLVS